MQTISALCRVTVVFFLLALLLIGGSYPASATSTQQRTCYYRLTKITSCMDDTSKDHCQSARGLNFSRFADGSVNAVVPGTTTQDSCVLNYKPDGGMNITCPNGFASLSWRIPPEYLFPDEAFSLTLNASAGGTFSTISGKYWFYPANTFKARPGGTGKSGGTLPAAGVPDPFDWIEVTKEESGRINVTKTGQINVWLAPELDTFSIGVVGSGWAKKPGGNATASVGYGVEYIYERCAAGQVVPSSSTGSSASTGPRSSAGPSSSTGQSSSSSPGSSTGSGATNTTLPMPPFNQAEPYTNTPGMAIQAAQRRVGVGELVNVPVWLIKGNNVANINYELTYNANVARPEGTIRKGYMLDNAFFSANLNTSGIIRIGFAQATGISGTGPVTYIPFRAVGKAGDRTPLSLAVTTINNPSGATLAIDRIPGEIVIVGADGLTPGDCEGTGKALSGLDVMCALEMSVKLIPVRLVMDMDNSRDVTSRDAAIIAQTILEIKR